VALSLFTKWWNRRHAFRNVFWRGSRDPDDVGALLADLRQFCRADVSCVVVGKDGRVDTHATAIAEGRREVWLRIVQTLDLTDSDLNKMKELEQ
jgi:hypothetical protein